VIFVENRQCEIGGAMLFDVRVGGVCRGICHGVTACDGVGNLGC
jgi:hypothetical protein